MTSEGLVMGLHPGSGYTWFPALDTGSHPLVAKKDLTAWVVGIDNSQLLCVLCKVGRPGGPELAIRPTCLE